MQHADYLRHDALALAGLVARGEASAAELLDAALAHLARVQPVLNPVAQLMEAQARAQLGRSAASGLLRSSVGDAAPPFAGVPFLLKDGLQDYAGVPTSYGSASMRRFVPSVHAATTRRFLDAGLVIFGKTNLPEFGLKGVTDSRTFGHARNPWDASRVTGGSSGGAAAAVASGVLPMAAGSDGGGSIRIPAACCGLFGLKPSRGRISEAPAFGEVWYGACTHGVLSRSVRDTAAALDVLCGPEPGDPFVIAPPAEPFVQAMRRPPRRLRIGFSAASPIGTEVHAQAVAAVRGAAALCEQLGHHVEEAAPAIDGQVLARAFLHLYFGQIPASVGYAMSQGAKHGDFELLTLVMAVLGQSVGAGTLTGELAQWNVFARSLGEFHQRFDLYLTPTIAAPPLPHGAVDPPAAQQAALKLLLRTGLLGLLARSGALKGTIDQLARDNLAPFPFTQLANLTGTPAMSVPLHWTADGLPLGVHFSAAMGDEATLLQLAAQLEQASPWFERLAPIARRA